MLDTQPIDVGESGVEAAAAKVIEEAGEEMLHRRSLRERCESDSSTNFRPCSDDKTMQILTSTYSLSRVCLIAILLIVNLIPRPVQAKEGPGNIWGVNAKNQIFTWTGNGWRQIAGELKYVSASADGAVWGVNSKDEVFRWTGNSFTPVPNGSLKQISVGNSSGGHPVRSRAN